MNDFSFHPEAETDLNEIWDFIAEDSVDAADRVRDHIYVGIQALARTGGNDSVRLGHLPHFRPRLSRTRTVNGGLDSFVTDESLRIYKAGLHVIPFEPGIFPQQVIGGVPGGQHTEDVLDRQTATADDRFAAEDIRIHRNPREQGVLLPNVSWRVSFNAQHRSRISRP